MPGGRQIATYIPQRDTSFEASGRATARGLEAATASETLRSSAHEVTPAELAALSRALQLLEATDGRPGVMTTVPDELASNLQTFLTVIAQEQGRLDASPNRTLEVRFDEHDILGWAGSFFTWWRRLDPFVWQTPDAPETLASRCRVAVFGDWGTGLYGAPACAQSIAADGAYDLVLHLGDVYYSGTRDEMVERFLDLWPKVPGAKNRALNGNHEMYTGGSAYFDAFRSFDQKASYFAFQNQHWILAALDTAYEDHDLHGDQVAWLQALAAASPEKKLILFSHHQPYSLLDSQGPQLIAKLGPLFTERRIHAWYWGHEHHCILYNPHALWGLRGRCVGHGGFPYFREKRTLGDQPPGKPTWKTLQSRNLVPGARILDGTNEYIEEHSEDYGPNGYMTLEFDGSELFEIVHAPDGTRVWAQPIDA